MKRLFCQMTHCDSHTSQASLALVLAAASASACSVDVPLGALAVDGSSLVDDPIAAAPEPVGYDAIAPSSLGAPEVTIGFADGDGSSATTGGIGDIDGDGFGDMASVVLDPTGTQYIHIRYGGPRPVGAAGAFDFSQSGARYILSTGFRDLPLDGIFPAGDVDGDGFGDVLIATIVCDGPRAGDGAFLLYGGPERKAGTFDLAASASHLTPQLWGGEGSSCMGSTAAAASDLDGDGFDDLVLVDPVTNPRVLVESAGVYVIHGAAERLPAEAAWGDVGVHFGVAQGASSVEVRQAGDIDGDGRAELLISYRASTATAYDSRLIVLRGDATRQAGDSLQLLDLQPQMARAEALQLNRPLGDLDGDGYADFVAYADATSANPGVVLFYGGPGLLSGPLDASLAAATLDDVAFLVPVGDVDGDGDDELISMDYVTDETDRLGGFAALTVSGTRTRLSGRVSVAPPTALSASQIYPDMPDRFVHDILPAGDLDNDGAMDVFTRSLELYVEENLYESRPMLHVHYGVKAEAQGGLR